MDKDYLIKKWLSDTLTEEEWREFRGLDDYNLLMKLSGKAKNFGASNFIETDDFQTLKNRITDRKKPIRKLDWYKPLLRIAAIMVLAFGTYFAFFSNNLTQIESSNGEKITAILPDATEVLLNAVSEIEYNEREWDEKRQLSLEGEAYFKVAKGSLFEVYTKTGKIGVLGTQFNVKNRNDFFEVVCYEGKVRVTYLGKTKDLIPGYLYRVIKGNVSMDTVRQGQPDWIKNSSSFKEVPYYEVLNEMERQYGITIEANSIDSDRLFNGGFVHNDLVEALRSITLPLGLQYTNESNKVVIKNIAR
tara:strand:+ start:1300 stop:2208 length:909 start_codon:yes stop_codon:yes gene_type:complete